jgi:polysaccharide export outer membrane protein
LTGEAPVASAADGPVPTTLSADYKIGPNDLLEVEVFGVEELKRTVRVNSTGHISLPLIGTIPVAGMTSSDAQALIANEYAKDYIQNPQVSIFIKEFTSQRITVDGAVVRPGIYPLVGQITLLRALAMAGGGAQLSDLEQVVLFRITPDGKSETQRYDVNKIRTGEAPDPMLQGDDIVVVNRNSARVNLRDSLFSDIINTLNPFSATYRNTTGGQ